MIDEKKKRSCYNFRMVIVIFGRDFEAIVVIDFGPKWIQKIKKKKKINFWITKGTEDRFKIVC